MDTLSEIINSLRQIKNDLKAEVLVSSLREKGIQKEQLVIRNEGVFKRAFRKDVVDAKLSEINLYDEMVEIILSRDGMYDLLPEGLFHQSQKGSNVSVQKMVEEHRRFKYEEDKARQFFMPFENEFFHQKVETEMTERRFYGRIYSEKNELLQHFWKIDRELPVEAAKRLLEFLPQASKILGNTELMQQTLSKILLEPVNINWTPNAKLQLVVQEEVNEMSLGIDAVVGQTFEEYMPQYEFTLGPFTHLRVEQFLHEAPYKKLLEKFYDSFVPIEAEIKTTFVTDKNQPKTENNAILGYNFEL
ncbi:MAG TPA: hypothetical protein PLU10_03120 [Chitinophagaceae bacterium]|nr:hypothetical protein [Chitinophagaceae bacterium]